MAVAERDEPSDATTLVDRRRPGRLSEVNPNLLPLLRADERAKLQPLDEAPEETDRRLDTGPGVLLGVGIGALLWVAMIAGGWTLATSL